MALSDAIAGVPTLQDLMARGMSIEDARALLEQIQRPIPLRTEATGAEILEMFGNPPGNRPTDSSQVEKPEQASKAPPAPKPATADKVFKEANRQIGELGVDRLIDDPNISSQQVRSALAPFLDSTNPSEVATTRQPDAARPGPVSRATGAVGGAVRGAAGGVASGVGKVASGVGSAMERLGDITPGTQAGLGRLAIALGGNQDPRVRSGLGQRLGQAGVASAQQAVMAKVVSGQEVSESDLAALTPQQLTQVAELRIRGQAEARQSVSAASRIRHEGALTTGQEQRDRESVARIAEMQKAKPNPMQIRSDGTTWLWDWDDKVYKQVASKPEGAGETLKYTPKELDNYHEAVNSLFYIYAADLAEAEFNVLSGQPMLNSSVIAGILREDPQLIAAWTAMHMRGDTLMGRGDSMASIMTAVREEFEAVLNQPTGDGTGPSIRAQYFPEQVVTK